MERFLKIFLILGMLIFAFLSLLRPVDDPDFWWHLKTGEYIADNGLPDQDPFAFTNPNIPEPRKRVILTGYWIPQLLYHGAFEALGFRGIILLRIVLMGIMYWSVLSRMRRSGVGGFAALAACGLSILSFFTYFYLDRPQVFSFLFFSLLMGMVESAGRGRRPSWLLIPLMALWANCHGGVIIGDAVLCIFAAAYLAEQRAAPRAAMPVILWAGAGIAASLANPNTYHFFLIVAIDIMTGAFSTFSQTIAEYQSSYTAFTEFGRRQVVYFWILLVLAMASLVPGRGRPLWRTAIIIFVGFISFRYIRNIPFLGVGLAPMAASALASGLRMLEGRRIPSGILKAAAVILLAMSFWHYSSAALDQGSLKRQAGEFYPAAAANFIATSGVTGNMFNDYDWGGYLIWRLYPQHKVFIDGRGIHEAVFNQYMEVSLGETTPVVGLPAWQAYLDAYRVDFVILQLYRQYTGQLQPLMLKLMNDPRWHPVYIDSRALIFVKDSDRNRQVIDRFAYEKNTFKQALLRQIESIERASGGNPKVYIMKGETLWYLGRYEEAEQAFLRAVQLSPNNETALNDLKTLRETVKGRSGD